MCGWPAVNELTDAALAVLNRTPFDPEARAAFEVLSGGLMWPDEFPRPGSVAWTVVSANWAPRLLLAYRASLTLGEERAEFRRRLGAGRPARPRLAGAAARAARRGGPEAAAGQPCDARRNGLAELEAHLGPDGRDEI